MSRRKWESGRRSESEGCCGPKRDEREREWTGLPGAEGLRWVLFALLIYLGVRGAQALAPTLKPLGWLVWVAFAVGWIPLSMDLSRRVLGRWPVRVQKARKRALPSRTCPHCGGRVERAQAVCPHCYRDLKVNCARCGRIFDFPPGVTNEPLCPECARDVRVRSAV